MSDEQNKVVKHLEMVQGVVNRLASNSFFIKGWSITILTVSLLFLSNNEQISKFFVLILVIPVFGFWLLDAYFLWQERLFRGIYNDVRCQSSTDFAMNVPAQYSKPGNSWFSAFFSNTLLIFYFIQLFFLIAGFLVLCFS